MNETVYDVVANRIASKIKTGTNNAEAAVSRLIEEGKIAEDFIAPLGVSLLAKGISPVMTFESNGHVKMNLPERQYTIHRNAVGQLGEKLHIPTGYITGLSTGEEWERELAAHVLNEHSKRTERTRTLIRAIGTEVRGVLSENYKRLNSVDIITEYLRATTKQGAMLADGYMDDTRVYIEVLMPQPFIINTPKNGEVAIAFGARLQTSDFGDGALDLRTFFMQGICLNGAVRESLMRKVHLGKTLPENIALSERTYRLETQTTCSAIRDISNTIFDRNSIGKKIHEIERASSMEVDIAVELANLQKGGSLLKKESDEITKLIMRNKPDDGVQGESTLWKLVQGISAQANQYEPRRMRDLQEIAGNLMNRAN